MSYSYRAYGLGIDSTIAIPGLEMCLESVQEPKLHVESDLEPDWVKYGRALPAQIISRGPEEQETVTPFFVLTCHGNGICYELSYADGARFVVDGTGERLWGTVRPPLTREDLAVYLLGPVVGFVLRHRHVTSLHASAVDICGRAVAFSGYAGDGKSTTAAALALRGVPVLAEDIVPLRQNEGRFWAAPGYPRVCLWPQAVEQLMGSADALPKIAPDWEKRYLALDGQCAHFAAEQKPLGLIYLFGERSPEPDAPRIEELRPREALLLLVQNTYMNWLLDRKQRAEEFDELAKIVQQVPVRRIIAHADGRKIGALCDLILSDARSLLKTT